MCLAVSGRILAIRSQPPPGCDTPGGIDAGGGDTDGDDTDDALWRLAEVDFGGVRQEVSLACLPQARVGDRVLVHVGLAIAQVESDEAEAPPTG